MSEAHGETYLDHAGMRALSETLGRGATALDETGARAPAAPDAGVSTPLVGELLGDMSGVVGDLVTAVDVTAASVRHSDETVGDADRGGAARLSAFDG
ncbi:MAG: hypothetical protein ACRDSP_19300 [Pseudonocardiaceae bacterium]